MMITVTMNRIYRDWFNNFTEINNNCVILNRQDYFDVGILPTVLRISTRRCNWLYVYVYLYSCLYIPVFTRFYYTRRVSVFHLSLFVVIVCVCRFTPGIVQISLLFIGALEWRWLQCFQLLPLAKRNEIQLV